MVNEFCLLIEILCDFKVFVLQKLLGFFFVVIEDNYLCMIWLCSGQIEDVVFSCYCSDEVVQLLVKVLVGCVCFQVDLVVVGVVWVLLGEVLFSWLMGGFEKSVLMVVVILVVFCLGVVNVNVQGFFEEQCVIIECIVFNYFGLIVVLLCDEVFGVFGSIDCVLVQIVFNLFVCDQEDQFFVEVWVVLGLCG